jgi:hypothetical protein
MMSLLAGRRSWADNCKLDGWIKSKLQGLQQWKTRKRSSKNVVQLTVGVEGERLKEEEEEEEQDRCWVVGALIEEMQAKVDAKFCTSLQGLRQ